MSAIDRAEIVADREIGDRQRGPVDVVDHAGHDQHGERGPLDRFDPRRRRHHLRYRHFLAPNCPVGLFASTKSTQCAAAVDALREVLSYFAHTQASTFLGSSDRRLLSTMLSWRKALWRRSKLLVKCEELISEDVHACSPASKRPLHARLQRQSLGEGLDAAGRRADP